MRAGDRREEKPKEQEQTFLNPDCEVGEGVKVPWTIELYMGHESRFCIEISMQSDY